MIKKTVLATVLALTSISALAWPTVDANSSSETVIQGAKDDMAKKATYDSGIFVGAVRQQFYLTSSFNCSNMPKNNFKMGQVFSTVAWTLESSTVDMRGWSPAGIIDFAYKQAFGCHD